MAEWDWPDTVIVAVKDGDTVDAIVRRDLGFGAEAKFPVRLRLHGINTPSLKSARGKAAAARLAALLPEGSTAMAVSHKPYKYGGPKDVCGEWMATFTLPDGRDVAGVLVAEKLATRWDGTGPRPDDT